MARQLGGAITFPAGIAVGVGVGGAVATVLDPRLRALANEAWSQFLSMPLQAIEAAQLVAEGERDMGWGKAEAENVGINGERFEALVDLLDTAPDLATLFEAFRRGLIGETAFRRGAKRHGIEDEWLDVLVALKARVLSPAEAANAWQQGFMDEGEASAEAALSGVTPERSAIQRQLAGNPPGPMDGLTLLRRGIITEAEYEQLVREGNIKTKYVDALLALRDRVLTGQEWAGLWLRGWATEAEAKAGGAAEGWSPENMERLYLNRGRPATTRQVHIGWSRGGRLAGAANEQEAFERSVRQSNIRTEYADLLWAQRHTYPSAFVIRALAQEGTFDETTTRAILVESGWREDYAELAAASWTGGGEAPGAGPWAKRARSQLFNRVHTEYVGRQLTDAEAEAGLTAAGVPALERGSVLDAWRFERDTVRTELTQAQIVKASKKGLIDESEALAELVERGMTERDAGIRLQSG